jgi:Uma2 family endonuclease
MVMPDTARRYTIAEVLAFPDDGKRYELVDGELLVTPAPTRRHQRVAARVHILLSSYLQAHPGAGEALFSPADLRFGGTELAQPDVFVVPVDGGTSWEDIEIVLLAVEVVSPGSARYDRVTKRRLYQRAGVPSYWVVDADARLVEVWHPDDDRPEIVTDVVRWRVGPDAPELDIALEDVFRDV